MFTLERSPEVSKSSLNKIKSFQNYFTEPIENKDFFKGNTPYSQTLNFSSIDFRLTEIGELLVTHIISDVEQESKSFTPNILFRGHLE